MPNFSTQPQSISSIQNQPANGLNAQQKSGSVDFSSVLDHAIIQRQISTDTVSRNTLAEPAISIKSTHNHHFPSNRSGDGKQEDLQQKMLGIRAHRQQIIASNIANADTPGYKAIDINIQEAANSNQVAALSMTKSSPAHFDERPGGQFSGLNIKYHTPYQDSADGNTVELDVERPKFAENTLMYQFSLDRVGGEFKHMTELFQTMK